MAKRILPKVATPIIPGAKFERLTVVAEADPAPREKRWLCRCECGKEKVVRTSSLRCQDARSCGCLQKERAAAAHETHGHAKRAGGRQSSEYVVWLGMRARCLNAGHEQYADYGGRGVVICERWLGPDGFANFLADLGPRPSPSHTLDRKENDGPYSPENCRWATRIEQGNNKRNNVWLEFRGERKTLAEWARATGIPVDTIRQRISKLGWSVQEALTYQPGTRG